MMYAMAWRPAVRAALAALVLTAACSPGSADKDSAGVSATVATEPPPTTTTNPYAVPTVIDIAYVNKVLAGLDGILGDVTRLVVRSKTIPPDAYDRLRSVYGKNDLLQLTIDSIQSDLRRGLTGYRSEPGDRVSTVVQVMAATGKCIFARVQRDYLAVTLNPTTINPQWVGLEIRDPNRDPKGYNGTPWAMIYDGFPQDRSIPTNPCVA